MDLTDSNMTQSTKPDHERATISLAPIASPGQIYAFASQIASLRHESKEPKAIGLVADGSPSSIQPLALEFALALTRFIDGKVLYIQPAIKSGGWLSRAALIAPDRKGWLEWVSGDASREECISLTSIDRLECMNYSGTAILNPARMSAELLEKATGAMMRERLSALAREYEFVVFLMPSVYHDITSLTLAGELNGVVVILEHRSARLRQVRRLIDHLTVHQAHVVGVVVNRFRSYLPSFLRRKR